MKAQLLILIFFIAVVNTQLFAVENNPSKCERSKIQAGADIRNKKIYFMLQGGIAPIYVAGQEAFEQKYKVSYFDLGCVVPANLCIEHYNAEVGKYLDKTYGKKWRKEVRKDVSLPKS